MPITLPEEGHFPLPSAATKPNLMKAREVERDIRSKKTERGKEEVGRDRGGDRIDVVNICI